MLLTPKGIKIYEIMGCFPSRPSDDDADSEIDLDLDSTPLLRDNSELTDNHNNGNVPASKHGDQNMGTDNRLETLLLKLEHAKSLKEKLHGLNSKAELESCQSKVVGILNAATIEMSRLIRENKYHDAEKVVKSILLLKTTLGDDFFEAARINAFGREITDIGSCLLTGGQYFKPVMFHEDDDSIVKLYFFVISEVDSSNVLFRYYLEHASFLDDYFALGLVTPQGHTQVEIYGSACPPYWGIRQDVINNATARLARLHDSDEFEFSDELSD